MSLGFKRLRPSQLKPFSDQVVDHSYTFVNSLMSITVRLQVIALDEHFIMVE